MKEHLPSSQLDGSGAMFDAIADRYDLVNRLISFGRDRGWRRHTASALQAPNRVLDLATGTGDLAIELARRYPEASVVGLDPSARMLEVARKKTRALALDTRITYVEGDAQELPFEDAQFDAVSMAFGIRNVPDRAAALRQMARVARVGARIAILELTEPRGLGLSLLARCHVHCIVPLVGALISGPGQYAYLSRSIAAFPAPGTFVQFAAECGLRLLELRSFSFGACHLFLFTPSATGSA
jgi:demethylmenaquinone methyltransferase/2-methoxy-6-polyprenyl-1,4-benzoquinol methylase